MLVPAMSSLIICSSHKPISLNRTATSLDVQSCLMRNGIPALTWLKGHVTDGHLFSSNRLKIVSVAALISAKTIASSRAVNYTSIVFRLPFFVAAVRAP